MRTKSELEDLIVELEREVDNLRDEYHSLGEYLGSLYDELDNGHFDGD